MHDDFKLYIELIALAASVAAFIWRTGQSASKVETRIDALDTKVTAVVTSHGKRMDDIESDARDDRRKREDLEKVVFDCVRRLDVLDANQRQHSRRMGAVEAEVTGGHPPVRPRRDTDPGRR